MKLLNDHPDLVSVPARMVLGKTVVDYRVPLIMQDELGVWPPAVPPDWLHD